MTDLAPPLSLSTSEKKLLLRIARESIADELRGSTETGRLLSTLAHSSALEAHRGAFVTLRSPGEQSEAAALRGCIGTVVARRPLYETVAQMACNAALRDPRFAPLTAPELDRVRVEISALTPLRPVASPQRLVTGRDGVQLTQGAHQAVFLPQVASEQNWTVEHLLEQLAVKAGLGPADWRGARLASFEAEVFGE